MTDTMTLDKPKKAISQVTPHNDHDLAAGVGDNLIDRVAAAQSHIASGIKRVVVCTHAKFSTLELCRTLQGLDIEVVFHPVDYSKEQSNVEKLAALGIQVIDAAKDLIPAIEKADCAIEDGARVSKIINAFDVPVKEDFFSVEQTSGGIRYFRENQPKYPVIDVATSPVKLDIENKRATPEGVIQSFSEATGKTLAGKRVLVLGFGSIGEGLARLTHVMGACVTVYDTLATKRMFAKHQGYDVADGKNFDHVLSQQDVILMATNSYQGTAISVEQLLLMKDGAIICNAGSGRGELGLELQKAGEFTFHDAQVAVKEHGEHLVITLAKGQLQKSVTVLGKAFPLNLHLGKGTSHDAIEVVMALLLSAALQGPTVRTPGLQALGLETQEEVAELLLEKDSKKHFEPRYVQSKNLDVSERPYGGVFIFHNELSNDANMSVVRAWFKAGSKTRGHYHRRSQEAYYVEKGTADVIVWPAVGEAKKKTYAMKNGDYLLVPEGYFHDVKVTSQDDFECLVIATPPFQLWDQFFNEERPKAE